MKSILILFSFTLLALGAGSTALASEVCEGKDMQTCYELGVSAHENGDFFTAAKHFREACYGDTEEACRTIEEDINNKEDLAQLEVELVQSVVGSLRGCTVTKSMKYGGTDDEAIQSYLEACHREDSGIYRNLCDITSMESCLKLNILKVINVFDWREDLQKREDACFSPGLGVKVCPLGDTNRTH